MTLVVKSLRSKAAVVEELRKRRLPENGTVAELKTRLAKSLEMDFGQLKPERLCNLRSQLSQVGEAINTLFCNFCADDGTKNVSYRLISTALL
mgnify:CR=1 FL=1